MYGGYKAIEFVTGSTDLIRNLDQYNFDYVYKTGSVDPSLPANPDDLLKHPDWKETTHPNAGKNGHRTFENAETGEKLRHDQGRPGKPGHEGKDHWHRPNPNSINDNDTYLDGNRNPVGKSSDPSHLYPLQ